MPDDKKISELTTASALVGVELIETVQGGINKKTTAQEIANLGGGAVSSVFTRTGAVAAATSDYDAVQIDNTPAGNISATNVQAAINELDTEKASIVGMFTAAGTNTYTVTVPNIAAYVSGQTFDILFTNANTTTSTLNVNALGAKSLLKSVSSNLVTGDIKAGHAFRVAYDGTNFQLLYNFNVGLGASGNFIYSNNLPMQVPSLSLSASAGTADAFAPVLSGSGAAATHTTRFANSASLIGFSFNDNGSSNFGAFDYEFVKIFTGNQPFNISTGAATFKTLHLRPTYNMTGGTTVITGIDYNPAETAMTGATHYGILQRSITALSGFATGTPHSTLQVAGSFAAAYVAKTANYTLTLNDYLVNCTANSFTITLPTAVGITGRQYIIKNTGTATTITMATTSSQTIDGAAPGTVVGLIPLRVMSDGANYITW